MNFSEYTAPKGRLRFAIMGYLFKLLSHLPAETRRKMMRDPQDAPLPSFADLLRMIQVCDPTAFFGWAAIPESIKEDFPHLSEVVATKKTIATAEGVVYMRLYRDPRLPATAALVWVHGGGFVCGSLEYAEANWVGHELASQGIPVLTVGYRKALHGLHYPAPSDDVLDGWKWAVAHADELGVAPLQLHLGGASAGGNLVAGVCKRLRDDGLPLPASLALVYPLLHSELPSLAPEDEALCRQHVKAFAEPIYIRDGYLNYVGKPANLHDPYATPAVGSLNGLPPTYIINAQYDSMRASGEAFAAQMVADGGIAICECEKGPRHGYLLTPSSPHAQSTTARIAHWIKTAWHRHKNTSSSGSYGF